METLRTIARMIIGGCAVIIVGAVLIDIFGAKQTASTPSAGEAASSKPAAPAAAEARPEPPAVRAQAPAAVVIDTDAAERRIAGFALFGRASILAPACKLRNDDWADDLESEASLEAVLPDITNDTGGKITSAESKYFNARLEEVKALAKATLAQQGVSATCAAFRKDRLLAEADALVKKFRAPHDWSGFGGKP